MGCDMHLHSEIKIKGGWNHYSSHNIQRDYEIFARFFGVRNTDYGFDPLFVPQCSIPDDSTLVTATDYKRFEDCAHDAGWLSAQDIGVFREELFNFYEKLRLGRGFLDSDLEHWFLKNYLFGNAFSLSECTKMCGVEDIRFIYWFDS